MQLSVIMPVYNEQETVAEVVERVRSCGVSDLEVLVVDDGSSDQTWQRLQRFAESPDVRLLRHPRNRGKGAVIRTAQPLTRGEAVVVQDGDLEYDPAELPKLLAAMRRFETDAVFGSRFSGNIIVVDSFWHYYGNRFLTLVSNLFTNLHLSDMETCYKMIRGELFRELPLRCERFGIEPELTAKLAARQAVICEVPISYRARRFDQGKKIGWRDGFAALWYIFKYNLLSRASRRRLARGK